MTRDKIPPHVPILPTARVPVLPESHGGPRLPSLPTKRAREVPTTPPPASHRAPGQIVDVTPDYALAITRKQGYIAKGTRRGKPGPKIDRRHNMGGDEWLGGNDWVLTISSDIRAIRFDRKVLHLFVEFKTGRVYLYAEVPTKVARGLFYAPSVGKYFASAIKWRYPYQPVAQVGHTSE